MRIGISAFKLVVGEYGGGKTHFLYCTRELAWQLRYAVSYVSLSPTECPFDKLELVYKSIVANLSYPPSSLEELMSFHERGIEAVVRIWFEKISQEMKSEVRPQDELDEYLSGIKGFESISFCNALKRSFLALKNGNEQEFSTLMQWLKGEEVDKSNYSEYGISESIDRATAFRMIRSLAQWIKTIGYSGLVLLFDEAERALSVASRGSEKKALDNLRQLVDECGNTKFPSVMIFYAIPNTNQILEQRGEVYEALKQRLVGTFSRINPSGVKIDMENIELEPIEFMAEVGARLGKIYNTAYSNSPLDDYVVKEAAKVLATAAYAERFVDIGYRRIFVKSFIEIMHLLVHTPGKRKITPDEAKQIVRGSIKGLEDGIKKESDEAEY
ncbi:MAG: DUF2791 family P-loop domain-containing protein [Candidatus Stahlbacteria bacterium]|nr:DUF2791 family P-loop domain-containing protein [Candidatus Stahlbacteria bacterium]